MGAAALTDWTVGDLERALLALYPASDAESWDRTGMLVGDPEAQLRGVCVALDPTLDAIRATADVGANVLVTHHPLFIDEPNSFLPADNTPLSTGSLVREAIELDVSIMSFHTACDASPRASQVLPRLLGIVSDRFLIESPANPSIGYGQVCSLTDQAPLRSQDLADRCTAVFNRANRLWGDPDTVISSVCTWTGSAGSAVEECMNQGIDLLIAGETRYHDVLAASQAGLCVIDLGHDVSELPLADLLLSSVLEVGIPAEAVSLIKQDSNWQ